MCYKGNAACSYAGDSSDHECRARRRAPEHERIARLMQRLAIAKANHYAEMTLDAEEIETIAEAFRLRALANGLGVMYDTYFVNPTFNRKQAEIRAGYDVCRWCHMARTPSNGHLHKECDKWLELAS